MSDDQTPPVKRSHDNETENYFLELVINKHIIDREIQEILDDIKTSDLHPDYQLLLKKVLFWEKNLYLEDWWTLASGLLDIVKTVDIRSNEISLYGVVLGVMLRVIEEVFDVDDEQMHDFLLSEQKEDIEHRLIILIKRVVEFVRAGLKEMFQNTTNLDLPVVDGHVRKEFDVIRDSLLQYSHLILESEGDHIRELKSQVDTVALRILEKKKNLKTLH